MSAETEGMPVSLARIEDAVDQLISHISRERILAGDEAGPGPNMKNESFDYQLEGLHTTLGVAQRKLWSKIRDVRKERNAVQPIFRLPNELLAAILLEVVQYAYPGGEWEIEEYLQHGMYYPELERYCKVHPLWRTVVESTPEFWTTVSNWNTDAQINQSLALSKAFPLDVFTLGTSDDKLKSFLRRTLPHVSRWGRLFAINLSSNVPLRLLERIEAPMLEQITLGIRLDSSFFKKLFIFSRGAPRLHTVHLTRVVVPYTAPWLRDLETLRIDLPRNTAYTLSRLLEMLRGNTTLRHLALVDFFITSLPDSSSVTLPYLECLEVSTVRSSDTGAILSAIKAPKCSELNIRWHKSTQQDPTTPALQSWESTFETKLLGEATLELGEPNLRNLLRLRTSLFTFTLMSNDIPLCAQWLLSQFLLGRSVKVTHLTELSDNKRLVTLLSMLPRYMVDVYALEYTVDCSASSSPDPILKCLQEPQRTDHGTEWLLPNLRIIKNPYRHMRKGPADFVEKALSDGRTSIEKRWGNGGEVWTSGGIEPPAALEDIVFPPFDSIKHLIQSPGTLPEAGNQA